MCPPKAPNYKLHTYLVRLYRFQRHYAAFFITLTKVRNLPVPQPTSRREAVSGSLSEMARPTRKIDRLRMASPMPHIYRRRRTESCRHLWRGGQGAGRTTA